MVVCLSSLSTGSAMLFLLLLQGTLALTTYSSKSGSVAASPAFLQSQQPASPQISPASRPSSAPPTLSTLAEADAVTGQVQGQMWSITYIILGPILAVLIVAIAFCIYRYRPLHWLLPSPRPTVTHAEDVEIAYIVEPQKYPAKQSVFQELDPVAQHQHQHRPHRYISNNRSSSSIALSPLENDSSVIAPPSVATVSSNRCPTHPLPHAATSGFEHSRGVSYTNGSLSRVSPSIPPFSTLNYCSATPASDMGSIRIHTVNSLNGHISAHSEKLPQYSVATIVVGHPPAYR
ncbi:hypothetical protein RTP6_000622 [Batrachochytrium dendrobatidis]